jgi:hypothetical protein
MGTMIGFLSHLVLDELFAVNLMGVVPKLNQFAGSALKLTSKSWPATLLTYAILCGLGYLAWVSVDADGNSLSRIGYTTPAITGNPVQAAGAKRTP